MTDDPNIPIARLGRWLDRLSLPDLVVLLLVSPGLGLVSVWGPALVSGFREVYPGGIMRNSVENMACGSTILCLIATGITVALLSRRLGVWAASTAMAGYVVWALVDGTLNSGSHNLIPFELAMYVLLTGFAMAGAVVVVLFRYGRA